MLPTQPIATRCPQCGQTINASLHSLVDVGLDPSLKETLLRGRLNLATCPHCGFRGRIGAPLLYHDPAHELAVAVIPMELNLAREEQERLIGTLANAITDALPPERRKFYLLNPRVVFTMQGLVDLVLEAEGVTPEMRQEQETRARLITAMLDVVGQDEALAQLVADNRAQIDYDFFLLIGSALEEAQEAGHELRARRLAVLRDRLIALTGGPSEPLPAPLPDDASAEDLIRALLAVPADELVEHVAVNRPRFDYPFFQTLTGQVEASQASGEAAQARQLADLRERLLSAIDTVDRDMQAALQQAVTLLEAILSSEDPRQVVQDRLDEVDDTFLLVLGANIAQARDDGQTEVAEALEGLYGYIISRLEQTLPPQLQLINRLLRLREPDQRGEVLDAEPSLVTPELAAQLEHIAGEAERQGQVELAERARAVRDEVAARAEA